MLAQLQIQKIQALTFRRRIQKFPKHAPYNRMNLHVKMFQKPQLYRVSSPFHKDCIQLFWGKTVSTEISRQPTFGGNSQGRKELLSS